VAVPTFARFELWKNSVPRAGRKAYLPAQSATQAGWIRFALAGGDRAVSQKIEARPMVILQPA